MQNENAFILLANWRKQARRSGKTPEEIKKVLDDAMLGDYQHLLKVLADNK